MSELRLVEAGVVVVTDDSAVNTDFHFRGPSGWDPKTLENIELQIAAYKWAISRLEFEIEDLETKL